MADFIKLYMNATEGETDGTEVSINMTQTNPIAMTLNAKTSEAKAVKVALRCEEGFQTYGDTTVAAYYFNGTKYVSSGGNVDKWRFAADEGFADASKALANGNWQSTLTIDSVITSVNHVFWVKAMSDTSEVPQKDTTVSIHIEGIVEAVE